MSQSHRPVLSKEARSTAPQATVLWPANAESAESWLARQPLAQLKEKFANDGYAVVQSLLSDSEVAILSELYDCFFNGRIDASSHRHDLGNTQPVQNAKFSENICQIMWPSIYVQGLSECPARSRLQLLVHHLLGNDMMVDFDMALAKPPMSNTPTPWHVDESYWPDMPDKRAVSCWMAVDATCKENGCMWFEPGSHLKEPRPHKAAGANTHVLACEGSEEWGEACPLSPGGCTLHSGRTAHYSRGNSTSGWRRGYIINFRPSDMVAFERSRGFDHGMGGLHSVIQAGAAHDSEAVTQL